MRKLFISAIFVLLSVAAFAQEGTHNIGFTMGFSEPILRERQLRSLNRYDTVRTTLNGFKAGLIYETTFVKGFGMSVGFNYTFSAKSGKWEQSSQHALYPRHKTNIIYNQFELPIDWQYKFTIAKETYLMLYTGPTLQCAINWTDFVRVQKNHVEEEKYISNAYTDEDADNDGKIDYSRFNITWGVGAGFQYKRYFIRGGYDFGIFSPYRDRYYNINSDNSWARKGRLDQWQIKLGIYLWQLK